MPTYEIEFTESGHVVVPQSVHEHVFEEAESALVDLDDAENLVVSPVLPNTVGGWILKQRNARGDRSLLAIEWLRKQPWESGLRRATWDAQQRTMRIPLVRGERRAPAESDRA